MVRRQLTNQESKSSLGCNPGRRQSCGKSIKSDSHQAQVYSCAFWRARYNRDRRGSSNYPKYLRLRNPLLNSTEERKQDVVQNDSEDSEVSNVST